MLEIKNPEKQNIMIALIAAVFGIVIILVPIVFINVGVYQFYFSYVGVVAILFGICYGVFYYNRYRQFNAFLEKQNELLVWEYKDEQYMAFVGELGKLQRAAQKKKVLILFAIELVIGGLLFILLPEGQKWLGILFFGFFAIMTVVFTIIFPESFKYQAIIKPYVTIIDENGAYIMGRFHKWTKAQAKIKDYNNGDNVYKVLAINYELFTRNGRMFQEWTAVIPEPDNKDMIAEAKRWVGRINKYSREQEKKNKEKLPFFEDLFYRMLGRNKMKKEEK